MSGTKVFVVIKEDQRPGYINIETQIFSTFIKAQNYINTKVPNDKDYTIKTLSYWIDNPSSDLATEIETGYTSD